ncbi:MAG: hypothetical protein ACR2HV_04325 [Acidimicrobiales bacterium]
MRKAFLAAAALATGLVTFYAAAVGPAAAEPANNGNGSAYGVSASGLIAVSPTITTSASQPPDTDAPVPVPSLVTVPLGGLAFEALVSVNARAHQADDIVPETLTVPVVPCAGLACSEPVTLTPVNIAAIASAENVGLLFTAPEGTVAGTELDLLGQLTGALGGLLTASAISSEAVAKCVDGQPVFDAGFQVAGLGGLIGGVLSPALQIVLDLLFALIGPGAALSSIVSIAPGVVTLFPDGIAIDGAVISVPLLDQVITVAHSEVHMAADCTVVAPPTTAPPRGPGGRLASTGSETPFLPIGVGLVALALVGAGVVRRSRKTATQ